MVTTTRSHDAEEMGGGGDLSPNIESIDRMDNENAGGDDGDVVVAAARDVDPIDRADVVNRILSYSLTIRVCVVFVPSRFAARSAN